MFHFLFPPHFVSRRHLFERPLISCVHNFPSSSALFREFGEDHLFARIRSFVFFAAGLDEESVGRHFSAWFSGFADHGGSGGGFD